MQRLFFNILCLARLAWNLPFSQWLAGIHACRPPSSDGNSHLSGNCFWSQPSWAPISLSQWALLPVKQSIDSPRIPRLSALASAAKTGRKKLGPLGLVMAALREHRFTHEKIA